MKPQPRTGCAPSLPGGACRFAGFARHPLRLGGAAGTAGSRVLINPGDLLRCRSQGRLAGVYRPPFAALGAGLDRAVFHKVADATARSLLARVADVLGPPP